MPVNRVPDSKKEIRNAVQMYMRTIPVSDKDCFLPVLFDWVRNRFFPAMEIGALKNGKPDTIQIGVTDIQVLSQEKEVLFQFQEQSWIPFDAAHAVLSNKSIQLAWKTANWIDTDENGAPSVFSVNAFFYLLEQEREPLKEYKADKDGVLFCVPCS